MVLQEIVRDKFLRLSPEQMDRLGSNEKQRVLVTTLSNLDSDVNINMYKGGGKREKRERERERERDQNHLMMFVVS